MLGAVVLWCAAGLSPGRGRGRGRGRAVRAGRRRSPLAASAVAGGEGRSSSLPLGPLRGLLPSEGGAPATPRKAAAGVLQPRVSQEKEQPDCPSCAGSCASVCLVPMAGVDDRSRAPKLLVLMLDVPLGKGLHPVCSAFLPYRVVHRRKALSREMEKELIIPLPHPVRPEDATRTQVLWIAGGKFTVRESKRARVLSAQWSHLGGTELLGWRRVLIL
ncbi:uncharacterized protein LOC121073407 isoform X2 [Cygnus olor]|uniref:uncharacterized protein LOC121073407 isoform X2 n=1 Tax=Cygnus olor TaxID=8869 RepID=UPI001ADE8C8D|nr:uncharacterized protein LOC121073407 isoform X2 [Cygnus olor]